LGDIYTGHRYGPEEAVQLFGADTAYTLSAYDDFIDHRIRNGRVLYAHMGNDDMQQHLSEMIRQGRLNRLEAVRNIAPLIGEMRLIKDEYEVEAAIEYVFRKNGAQQPGFESMVASGSKTTIMHYHHNNEKMEEGDLLLMDIGAEYDHYTADVTRIIPVNGTFSKEQAELYQLV